MDTARDEQVRRAEGWHAHPHGHGIAWWDGTAWTISVPPYRARRDAASSLLRRVFGGARRPRHSSAVLSSLR